MATGKTAALRVGSLALLAALAACGPSQKEPPLENFTAEEIYKRGEYELENTRNPESAIYYFSEIERLYPYSEWAKRALIMQAFSHHRARQYEEARGAAQRFIDTYPGDQDEAYAKYLLALSYYDQIDEVGRDQGLTFQALQALRAVIEEYPDSDYARSAALKFDLAFDHLASKEMEIGRFYLKKGHYTAAINRFRVVVEQYQTTTHTPEALMRLIAAGAQVQAFPDDVLAAAFAESRKVYEEFAASNEGFRKIYDNWSAYWQKQQQWLRVAELPYDYFTSAQTGG